MPEAEPHQGRKSRPMVTLAPDPAGGRRNASEGPGYGVV